MRVIHAISAFQLGGAEEVACNLAVAQREVGHDVMVVAIGRPRSVDHIGERQQARLTEEGVPFTTLGGTSTTVNQVITPLKLLSLVSSWKPDVVHSHTDIPDAAVSFASRLNRRLRVFRTIHNTELWATHRTFGGIVERGLDDELVVAVSDDARHAYIELRRRYSLPVCNRLVVIPNGVSPPSDSPESTLTQVRSDLGLDPSKINICFAGRLDPQKGFDVLLAALSSLPVDIADRLRVHVFGHGPEEAAYREEAATGRLPVTFHEPMPGLRNWMHIFDGIVAPSRFEGMPLVALEALVSAVPLIASDAPGLRDALPPDWPLTVPVGDSEALAAMIGGLVDGSLVSGGLVGAARDWALNQYGIDAWVEAYERAYESSLGQPT